MHHPRRSRGTADAQASALQSIASTLLDAAQLQLMAIEKLQQAIQDLQQSGRDHEAGSPATAPLTRREGHVLELLGQGMSNRGISLKLGISEHTVRTHLQAIFRKLGAEQRTDAVVRAFQAGLLGDP